jgi:hypothetical protein
MQENKYDVHLIWITTDLTFRQGFNVSSPLNKTSYLTHSSSALSDLGGCVCNTLVLPLHKHMH